MSVIDLPQDLTVIDTVRPNLAIIPATNDHLICENGAKREDGGVVATGRAASRHSVSVGVPQAHCAVFRACDELVGDTWHEPDAKDGLSMILA